MVRGAYGAHDDKAAAARAAAQPQPAPAETPAPEQPAQTATADAPSSPVQAPAPTPVAAEEPKAEEPKGATGDSKPGDAELGKSGKPAETATQAASSEATPGAPKADDAKAEPEDVKADDEPADVGKSGQTSGTKTGQSTAPVEDTPKATNAPKAKANFDPDTGKPLHPEAEAEGAKLTAAAEKRKAEAEAKETKKPSKKSDAPSVGDTLKTGASALAKGAEAGAEGVGKGLGGLVKAGGDVAQRVAGSKALGDAGEALVKTGQQVAGKAVDLGKQGVEKAKAALTPSDSEAEATRKQKKQEKAREGVAGAKDRLAARRAEAEKTETPPGEMPASGKGKGPDTTSDADKAENERLNAAARKEREDPNRETTKLKKGESVVMRAGGEKKPDENAGWKPGDAPKTAAADDEEDDDPLLKHLVKGGRRAKAKRDADAAKAAADAKKAEAKPGEVLQPDAAKDDDDDAPDAAAAATTEKEGTLAGRIKTDDPKIAGGTASGGSKPKPPGERRHTPASRHAEMSKTDHPKHKAAIDLHDKLRGMFSGRGKKGKEARAKREALGLKKDDIDNIRARVHTQAKKAAGTDDHNDPKYRDAYAGAMTDHVHKLSREHGLGLHPEEGEGEKSAEKPVGETPTEKGAKRPPIDDAAAAVAARAEQPEPKRKKAVGEDKDYEPSLTSLLNEWV